MRQPQARVSLLPACLLLTALVVALSGCPSAPPPYHPPPVVPPPAAEGVRYTIQRGDTLYSIAKAYGADWRDIVRANRGLNPADLTVGQEIIIPNSAGPVSSGVVSPAPKPEFNSGHPGPIAAENDLLWPVQGDLIGKFRQRVPWRRGETNQGIDIRAPEGTAVVAARSGRVNAFSRFPGYGKSVMLEHQDGSITFYGYLGEVLCSHGTWVRQGEVIGTVGQTGLSSGAQLHFRVWKGEKFVDPMGALK